MASLWTSVKKELNFFRIHLLFFTFTPLIFSAIFYAANGQFHISYTDALYNCVSAIAVCGLATVDLSSLTGFQQAILFFLQCVGSPVVVSWVIVYVRRRYFEKKFEHIVIAELAKNKALVGPPKEGWRGATFSRNFIRLFSRGQTITVVDETESEAQSQDEKSKKRVGLFSKGTLRKLRPDMIRRMDDAPKPVDPNGWITEDPESVMQSRHTPGNTPIATTPARSSTTSLVEDVPHHSRQHNLTGTTLRDDTAEPDGYSDDRNISLQRPSGDIQEIQSSAENGHVPPRLARAATLQPARTGIPLGHSLTVEFRTPERELRDRRASSVYPDDRPEHLRSKSDLGGSRRISTSGEPVVHDDRHVHGGLPLGHRTATVHTHRTQRSAIHEGYGGFPGPQILLLKLFHKFFPKLEQKFVRTVTLPRTQTFQSTFPRTFSSMPVDGIKSVPYISFDAIVGRNSNFHLLTEQNLEELGGVEYRALTALLWIVGGYHICTQLFAFIIIAPYISIHRWRSAFEPPNLHRYVPPAWFAAFQVVSAYTNSGMSLVDQSMIPFQKAYPMIIFMAFLILAGNTAFPVFLRFTIWIISKLVPFKSRTNETLHFLLDHPRRCFIYLFPSHQTWFLLTVLIMLNGTDYFFFLVLDIGNAAVDAIPVGVRFGIGLLQAVAVRAAGFATVSLSSLAPAVQVLYVMMMYISVYPIAMSVRSTNVYEEKSLGVYDDWDENEDEPSPEGTRVAVWGRYLAWHARRQLAFDMWWLGLALFFVCIIERSKIQNQDNLQWFTIFNIIFELISAYGTVGLSLGVPYANFSFSGAFSPLSKLIVCAVMLRGRHRGLPVAIDRAVMLPFEFKRDSHPREVDDATTDNQQDQQRPSTGDTAFKRTRTKTQIDFTRTPS